MGKFINENTQKFNTESNGQYKNYIKNCLEGFPCVVILNVDYEIAGSTSEYYFLGIYNFNLGRGSYSNLGYVNNSIFNAKLQSVTNNNPFLFVKTTTDEYELRTDFGCAEITGNDPKFDFLNGMILYYIHLKMSLVTHICGMILLQVRKVHLNLH